MLVELSDGESLWVVNIGLRFRAEPTVYKKMLKYLIANSG
jgi:hypothetical protein